MRQDLDYNKLMGHSLKNQIEEKLKKSGVEYKFIPLPPDLAIDVGAHVQFHGITPKEAVPTILYKTEKGLIGAQRRVDTKINEKKLRELAGVKELRLGSAADLKELGVEVGVVPIVGLEIPIYTDKKVLEVKEIYSGSGDRLFALKMKSADVVKVNKSVIGDFAEVDQKVGQKKRVYAGMRPTGHLHVGNYLGSAKGMIELQNRGDLDCIFQVVTLHGITTPYEKETYQKNVYSVVLDYLGAGLDPKKCHIGIQLEEDIILSYYLGTVYPVSRLEDLPTYKDKKLQHPDYVNMGLLYYPVLMAADILLYKAELVPVGIDQEPHIEVTREVARKFNSMFGQTFPEPKRFDTPGRYVPSLTGEGKMSKSVEGSYINLTDDFEAIKAKIAKIPTDSGKGDKFPTEGPVVNFVNFVELFLGHDRGMQLREQYKSEGLRYGDLKKELAQAIYDELRPIQERRKYFEEHPVEVDRILAEGKEYAKSIASQTLGEVREKMGLV